MKDSRQGHKELAPLYTASRIGTAADRNLVGAAKNWKEGRKGMTPEWYRDSYWGKENALEFMEVISQALYTERHVLAVYKCGEVPLFAHLESRFHGMNYVTIKKKSHKPKQCHGKNWGH